MGTNLKNEDKTVKVSEKVLEKKLKAKVGGAGGLCLKYHNSFDTSYPDRLIIIKGGLSAWVELKTTGEKLTKLQEHQVQKLRALGQNVFIVDSYESLDACLKSMNIKKQ